MNEERPVYHGPWVAAMRIGYKRYVKHADSPEFYDVGELMTWLLERNLIARSEDGEGFVGWGNPWSAVPPEKCAPASEAARADRIDSNRVQLNIVERLSVIERSGQWGIEVRVNGTVADWIVADDEEQAKRMLDDIVSMVREIGGRVDG